MMAKTEWRSRSCQGKIEAIQQSWTPLSSFVSLAQTLGTTFGALHGVYSRNPKLALDFPIKRKSRTKALTKDPLVLQLLAVIEKDGQSERALLQKAGYDETSITKLRYGKHFASFDKLRNLGRVVGLELTWTVRAPSASGEMK